MSMDIYHGSKVIVEKPIFGKGKIYNDYGQGFYCTEDAQLAREWASSEAQYGYVSHYIFHNDRLKNLNLTNDRFSVLHWITILIQNRTFDITAPLAREAVRYLSDHFSTDLSGFDTITGYRADDSYFSYAQAFINGTISVRQLGQALKYGDLGKQIVLKSRKAFDAIEFAGYERIDCALWFPRKCSRDAIARKKYLDMDKEGFVKGDIYIFKILDEEMKADDLRLR